MTTVEQERDSSFFAAATAAFLVAYAIHAVGVVASHRHLYGDAAMFLVRMFSDGTVTWFYTDFAREFYYSRFLAFWLTQGPAVAAIRSGVTDPETVSFIFGATFFFWKFASVAVSYWLLPADRKPFILFPVVSILAGTINSEVYLVTETHIASAFFWPLLFACVWLPSRVSWGRGIALSIAIVVTAFLYESMALLFLAPLIVLAKGLREGKWDAPSRSKILVLVALLALGILMNVGAILFPRDPTNKAGFIAGIMALFRDAMRGHAYFHVGPTISVAFLAMAAVAMALPLRVRWACAVLGAAALAAWPAYHFLSFRDQVDLSYQIIDRGFGGFAMQLLLVLLFASALAARAWTLEPSRLRSVTVLTGGLLLGQLAWQTLATQAWVRATTALRQAVATRSGPVSCAILDQELGKLLRPSLDRVLCSWWVTPLSIFLAPDGRVRALALSTHEYKPFDPLNPGGMPSMRHSAVSFEPYVRELTRVGSVGPGGRVSFTAAGHGWLLTRKGFAAPESWATWSAGKTATLRLCFPVAAIRDGHVPLRFKVGGFVPPKRPSLGVRISAGGQEVGEWQFRHPEAVVERELRLPASALGSGCASVDFTMSDVASPASLGLSGDPRQLGIALVEMRIDK